MHDEGQHQPGAPLPVTPPAILALGAGSLVCALTASASILGWPRELRRPSPRRLSPEEREALLGMVPWGETVRIEAVEGAAALAFAQAALAFLLAEGRLVDERMVFTIRGLVGTGLLHTVGAGGHSLLVLGEADDLPSGQPPAVMG
jgi:hypothetical protein